MSNDLTTLVSTLRTRLRDTDSTKYNWQTTELNDIVTRAVSQLWPRYARPLDPTASTITLVSGTYFYSLPTGCLAISRLDRVSGTTELGPIGDRAWELVGDVRGGSGKIHIGPVYADGADGDTLRVNGYGRYDVTTNYIPDELIPLVLARARVDAYREVAGDRARFTEWLARNQTSNVSVNELLQAVREAENEVERLERTIPKTWQLPVAARVG